jgi:hypothetical protein
MIVMKVSAMGQDQLDHCRIGGIPARPVIPAITRARGSHLDIPPYLSYRLFPGYKQSSSILFM